MAEEYVYLIFECSYSMVDYDNHHVSLYKIVKNEIEAKNFIKIKDKYNFYKYIKIKINDKCCIDLSNGFYSIINY